MLERLLADSSRVKPPASAPHLTLKEQLEIDGSIREQLGVCSVIVIEDSKLSDTCPWKVCRRASADAEGITTMSAEIRISPAIANQLVRSDSSSYAHMRQMLAALSYVVKETGARSTEVSLDTALPISKPYRCVNKLDADDSFITCVSISTDFAKRLEQPLEPTRYCAVRAFEADLRVLSERALVLLPAVDGVFKVSYGSHTSSSYPVPESVKHTIDLFMSCLPLFNPDARRYDPHAQSLLDPLLYHSTQLHRLANTSQFAQADLDPVERYEMYKRLLEQESTHEEALSQVSEQTRKFFGDELLESLLLAVEELQGDASSARGYFRDFSTIHGYRYWQHQERLEYLFEAHPLVQHIAAYNRRLSDQRASDQGRDQGILELGAILFLEFRLSSADISLPPHAEVVLSSPYEETFNHKYNERLVCVNLTPEALKRLLNAKSRQDESIRPLMEQIDQATERLFGAMRR
jgi:hypothetical protein